MKKWAVLFSAMVAVALVVAACGGAAPTPQAPADAMDGSESDEMVKADMVDDVSDEPMDKESDAMMDEESDDDMMDGDSDDDMMDKESDDDMMDEDSGDDMMDEDSGDDMMDKSSEDNMMEEDSDDMMDEDSDDMMDEDSDDDMMGEDSDDDMMDEDSDDDMMDEGSDDMMDEDAETMLDLPAWYSASLIDVSSGESFSIADAQGKVILVETMAIWCSNCLRQQQEVKALHETLGDRDDLITVVLDIDLNEDAEKLSTYAAQHGFDWAYAVAPPEVAREISRLYGAQFLNPPSTPMLIIDRHGEAHPLPFGHKTADDLLEALAPFLEQDR